MALFIFPALGIILLFVCIKWRLNIMKKLQYCKPIKGKIVSINSCQGSSFSNMGSNCNLYNFTVEYCIEDIMYKIDSNARESNFKYKTGDIVDLLYNPNMPSEAYVKNELFVGTNMAFAIAGLFICFGTLLAIVLWNHPAGK